MIDTLVFSGGGIKSIGFIGCLECLLNNNLYDIDNIKTIIGTSGGSIIATFLAIGYDIKEINDLALELDLGIIRDISLDNILNFFNNYGFDSGNELERVLEIIIKKKTKENLTFKELYEIKGKKLIINAVCINEQQTEYFSYENYPDLKISLAIRMSSSIPMIFKPVKFNNKLYVDGAVLDNLSLQLCGNNFIGFYIANFNNFEKIKSIDEYLYSLITLMMNKLNSPKYFDNKDKIICLDLSDIDSTNFEMNKENKADIINRCYIMTEKFIKEKLLSKNDCHNLKNIQENNEIEKNSDLNNDKIQEIIKNIYLNGLLYNDNTITFENKNISINIHNHIYI